MTERKTMVVKIHITNPKESWIVGRVSGMIDAIANDGRSFLELVGYAVEQHKTYNSNKLRIENCYVLQADVSRDEFDKILIMLDRSYGDHRLLNYEVGCDW